MRPVGIERELTDGKEYIFVPKCYPSVAFVGKFRARHHTGERVDKSIKRAVGIVGYKNGALEVFHSSTNRYFFPTSIFNIFTYNAPNLRSIESGITAVQKERNDSLRAQPFEQNEGLYGIHRNVLNTINLGRTYFVPNEMLGLVATLTASGLKVDPERFRESPHYKSVCLFRYELMGIKIGYMDGEEFKSFFSVSLMERGGAPILETSPVTSNAQYFLYDRGNPIFQQMMDMYPFVLLGTDSPEYAAHFDPQRERFLRYLEEQRRRREEEMRQREEENRRMREEMSRRWDQEHINRLQTAQEEREIQDTRTELRPELKRKIEDQRKEQIEEFKKSRLAAEEYAKSVADEAEQEFDDCILCAEPLDNVHGPDDSCESKKCGNDVVIVCPENHRFHRECIIKSCSRGKVDTNAQMSAPERYGSNLKEQINKDKCPFCTKPLLYKCDGFKTVDRVPTEALIIRKNNEGEEEEGKTGGKHSLKRKLTRRRKSTKRYHSRKMRRTRRKY